MDVRRHTTHDTMCVDHGATRVPADSTAMPAVVSSMTTTMPRLIAISFVYLPAWCLQHVLTMPRY